MMQRERQRKRKDRQQWLRYRLSATINRHRRCLSPRCRFPATIIRSPRKIIPLYLLPSFFFLSFSPSVHVILSVYILEKFVYSPILVSVLSSYLHHGIYRISFLFCHLSCKLYGKWRYSFRGEKLGPLEEVGEIEDRGRMLNLPTTRSKSDITMENDEGRCHPLRTIYTYIHVYTYVYVDEFSLKDLLRLIDRPRRQVHVSSRSYVLA